MSVFNDLTGNTYNRLMALYRVPNEGKHTMWQCLCDCGKLPIVRAQHLRNGNTKSCGCWDADVLAARSTKHGGCGTPTYESWKAMIQRCTNKANAEWANYGGRGITVSMRWRDFAKFRSDMGDRPTGLTLDRENVDKNYSKANCRWATAKQQAENKRTTRWIVHNAKKQTLSSWARELKISAGTLHGRIAKYGESAAIVHFLQRVQI